MKSHLLIFAIYIVLQTNTAFSDELIVPPKEEWVRETSIEQVEKQDSEKTEDMIKSFSEKDVITKISDGNGNFRELTQEEMKRLIETQRQGSIVNSKKWQYLKSQYQKGDQVIRYEAPPLAGDCGYLLVRNGKVLVNVVTEIR